MSDREPVSVGVLNRRHPDFARIAVKLGRAMGREAEAIAALQMAEADKGRFNLENDEVGAALLELGDWQGTATELLEALVAIDAGFGGKWSAKRLGKRIARLWPHLESVLHATREADGHSKQAVYHFAGFAGFQNAISGKVYISSSREEFRQNTSPNPANPADTIPQDANGSFSVSSTTVVQKVHAPEELAAVDAEVLKYVYRPDRHTKCVPDLAAGDTDDETFLTEEWQPGDPVAMSAVIVGKPESFLPIPNFGLGSIGDPLGEHVDLFDVRNDW